MEMSEECFVLINQFKIACKVRHKTHRAEVNLKKEGSGGWGGAGKSNV